MNNIPLVVYDTDKMRYYKLYISALDCHREGDCTRFDDVRALRTSPRDDGGRWRDPGMGPMGFRNKKTTLDC